MITVKHILRTKGNAVLSAAPTVPVREALTRMLDINVGSLVVVQDGRVIGLFTERDFARTVAREGESSVLGTVGDIMSGDVLYVTPDATIDQCMALMTERRTRHLPVIENDELVGIVSIGDVVKALIEDKDFAIDQLERYISGR